MLHLPLPVAPAFCAVGGTTTWTVSAGCVDPGRLCTDPGYAPRQSASTRRNNAFDFIFRNVPGLSYLQFNAGVSVQLDDGTYYSTSMSKAVFSPSVRILAAACSRMLCGMANT